MMPALIVSRSMFLAIILSFVLLSHYKCECFCPSTSSSSPINEIHNNHRFYGPTSTRISSSSSSFKPTSTTTVLFGSADALLKMVEEVSEGQFSPEVVNKMSELERALATFLEEQRQASQQQPADVNTNIILPPQPPKIPPPLQSFIDVDETQEERINSLHKAEKALETLRAKLHEEEETLQNAELALIQSMQEQEVLRRAEIALEKSRAAAEQRKLDAIRATEEAMAKAAEQQQTRQNEEQTASHLEALQYDLLVGEDDPTSWQLAQDTDLINSNNNNINNGIINGVGGGEEQEGNASVGRRTIPLDFLTNADNGNAAIDFPVITDGPPGIPILYDWTQYIDGTIYGRVKGSKKFQDGATVSTSPVTDGVQPGTVIQTQSGSRYYLDKIRSISHQQQEQQQSPTTPTPNNNNIKNESFEPTTPPPNADATVNGRAVQDRQSQPKVSVAPLGVPSILNWELLEDGGISGLIYGSPTAEDGDYVETSPISQGSIESGCLVETTSGSKYFLSPQSAEREENVLAAFKGLAAARRGQTITITKELNEQKAQKALEELEQRSGEKRSTFSLGELFGIKRPSAANVNEKTKAEVAAAASAGIPTLSQWNTNVDGSITGLVYGSLSLTDGDLITTSPIAQGDVRAKGMVTTISGSIYHLE